MSATELRPSGSPAADPHADQKRRVHDLIESHRHDIEEFLAEYVRRRSIDPRRELIDVEAGGTNECQEWLFGRLLELGTFETVERRPAGPDQITVAARLPMSGHGEHRSLTFNGHTDVVPVTAEQYREWVDEDPWSGTIIDGYLYGRGAADMKGGSTAAIWATHLLIQAGVVPEGLCSLTFTVGEESGHKEIGPLAVLDDGYGADLVVIPEPTGLDVCAAAVGWFFFRIEVEGQAAHAAGRGKSIHPSEQGATGVNAIELMARIMTRLRELETQWGLHVRHPLMEPGTMAINPIHISGGALQATTPEYCSADFTVIVSPNLTCDEAIQQIRDVVESVSIGDPWLTAHPPVITAPFLQDAYESVPLPENSNARDIFLAARNGHGTPGRIALLATPSDANFFAAEGQETIVCGPGRFVGDGVHGLNERISIDSVIDAAKTYASFVIDWCSIPRKNN